VITEPGASTDDPKGQGLSGFCGKDIGDRSDEDLDGLVYGAVKSLKYGPGSGYCYYRNIPNQPYNCANCGVGSCQYSFAIECEPSTSGDA